MPQRKNLGRPSREATEDGVTPPGHRPARRRSTARDATARSICRVSQPARPRRDPPGVARAPPRGVTVFADRSDESGAAQPQKRRRHFPPAHRLSVCSPVLVRFPAHALSRRLQRVSESCTRVSRAQAPRRRPRFQCGHLRRFNVNSSGSSSRSSSSSYPVRSSRKSGA